MRPPTAYEELDEIEAPSGIEKGGVEAATEERMLLGHPRRALVVEYADGEGQTKAVVICSSDLEQIFEVMLEPAQPVACYVLATRAITPEPGTNF
jgi:hypothetical protein